LSFFFVLLFLLVLQGEKGEQKRKQKKRGVFLWTFFPIGDSSTFFKHFMGPLEQDTLL